MIIAGWGFSATGVCLLLLLTNSLIKAYASNHWPSVLGELQSSGIKSVTVTSGYGNNRSSIGGDKVNFLYNYTVNGQSHSSKRVTFSDYITKTGNTLNSIIRKHENRELVDVYYNPDNPGESIDTRCINL